VYGKGREDGRREGGRERGRKGEREGGRQLEGGGEREEGRGWELYLFQYFLPTLVTFLFGGRRRGGREGKQRRQ